MAMSSDHITGFAIGLGAAALGFYLYKNNQRQVDEFLRKYGIELPAGGSLDTDNMSIEDLVSEKEKLEDLIAEREYAAAHGDDGGEAGKARSKTKRKTRAKKASAES
jgi:hypothetical protein